MKKYILSLFALILFCAACGKKQQNDPFLIEKNHIGALTNKIQVRQLDSIFQEDSVVVEKETGIFDSGNKVVVYEKGGKQLLILKPVQDFDSTSTIGNIQVIDPRFKTRAGLGPESTFKDLVENHTISRTETTLDAVVVFIDEINAYVTFEKESLPAKVQHSEDIEASQIPETAKIKYFWIGWQ